MDKPTIPKHPLSRSIASAAILVLGAAFAAADTFAFDESTAGQLDVKYGGKTVGRYMFAYDTSSAGRKDETYKPYLHVFDAAGEKPVTKGPGGQFPHHRGIYLGWNGIKVDGKRYDRWHMRDGAQIHREFISKEADADSATFVSRIDWEGRGDEEPILSELRTIRFSKAPAPAYVRIDVHSKVSAIAGDTELGGDPEHAGLQFRPANEVDAKATRYLFPKAGADAKKDRDYDWVGQSFTLGGRQTHVIYLNHPENPRETVFSAYRDYGRFGAFYRAKLKKDEALELRVRFLLLEEKMPDAEWIQKQHNEYTGSERPIPETTERKPG
jgi:hypothetical protein